MSSTTSREKLRVGPPCTKPPQAISISTLTPAAMVELQTPGGSSATCLAPRTGLLQTTWTGMELAATWRTSLPQRPRRHSAPGHQTVRRISLSAHSCLEA
ncbi:unnamed protein product [Symbiodinium natans]|uniref:Uncharacterized protein n=1 Tax=Symbiodinium natans TaxID=878477 RepID=A0A812M8A0_9DINO|nr:unnamed protein product [Symbiodinium natans]